MATCLQNLAAESKKRYLSFLALQVRHVVVQLRRQREQRPAPGTAGNYLSHQPPGQLLGQRGDRNSEQLSRGLPSAGQARIVQRRELPGDARLQRLQ